MEIAQAKICFRYIELRKMELSDSQDPIVPALDLHLWASETIGFKRHSLNLLSSSFMWAETSAFHLIQPASHITHR